MPSIDGARPASFFHLDDGQGWEGRLSPRKDAIPFAVIVGDPKAIACELGDCVARVTAFVIVNGDVIPAIILRQPLPDRNPAIPERSRLSRDPLAGERLGGELGGVEGGRCMATRAYEWKPRHSPEYVEPSEYVPSKLGLVSGDNETLQVAQFGRLRARHFGTRLPLNHPSPPTSGSTGSSSAASTSPRSRYSPSS